MRDFLLVIILFAILSCNEKNSIKKEVQFIKSFKDDNSFLNEQLETTFKNDIEIYKYSSGSSFLVNYKTDSALLIVDSDSINLEFNHSILIKNISDMNYSVILKFKSNIQAMDANSSYYFLKGTGLLMSESTVWNNSIVLTKTPDKNVTKLIPIFLQKIKYTDIIEVEEAILKRAQQVQ